MAEKLDRDRREIRYLFARRHDSSGDLAGPRMHFIYARWLIAGHIERIRKVEGKVKS